MAALGWLLNLDFAASSGISVIVTGGSDFQSIWAFEDGMLTPLTSDTVTGSDTISMAGPFTFGGFDLNCDGTNAGTLIVRDGSASGTILVKTSSVTGKVAVVPQPCSGTIYYSVSGTGASAFLWKWE